MDVIYGLKIDPPDYSTTLDGVRREPPGLLSSGGDLSNSLLLLARLSIEPQRSKEPLNVMCS